MSIAPAFGGEAAEKTAGQGGDRWRTPPALVASCAERWGPFDLDIAAEPGASVAPRWWGPGGEREDALHLTVADVYATPKSLRVFCNPPFTRITEFLALCVKLGRCGHTVISIAKVVPETAWWTPIWERASEVWVPDARLKFVHPDGPGPRFAWVDGKKKRLADSPSHAHAIVVWGPHPESGLPSRADGRNYWPLAWRRCRLGPDQGVISWE